MHETPTSCPITIHQLSGQNTILYADPNDTIHDVCWWIADHPAHFQLEIIHPTQISFFLDTEIAPYHMPLQTPMTLNMVITAMPAPQIPTKDDVHEFNQWMDRRDPTPLTQQTIAFSRSYYPPESIRHFFSAYKENQTIETLIIHLDHYTIRHLSSVLIHKHKPLKHLLSFHNHLTDDDITSIITIIHEATSLETLDIRNSLIGERGIILLLQSYSLAHHPTLREFSITSPRLTDQLLTHVALQFRDPSRMQCLSISEENRKYTTKLWVHQYTNGDIWIQTADHQLRQRLEDAFLKHTTKRLVQPKTNEQRTTK